MTSVSSGRGSLVIPFILCGGSGTRLWPVSRASMPKQFQPFYGTRTLLQDTLLRVRGEGFAEPVLLAAEEHRYIVADQASSVGLPSATVVLEPVGRNTAPAALAASLFAGQSDPEALVLLLPSDHLIPDGEAFRAAIAEAVPAARNGAVCLFGVTPDRPETGYGYVEIGTEPVPDGESRVRRVSRFVEKPDAATAADMLAKGGFAWNAGIFLFAAATLIGEAEARQPDLLAGVQRALDGAAWDGRFLRLEPGSFEALRSVSLDYALIEGGERNAVLPIDLSWSDLGAWDAVHDAHAPDSDGNVVLGRSLAVGSRGTFVRSERHLVATLGVENLIVVATDDALLVADRRHAQDVKHLLDRLKEAGHAEATGHTEMQRPWGSYRSLVSAERFQVKLITVKPGGRLSLQLHHHRAEHWVVVKGTARITCGERVFTLYENQSTYIPQGDVHRLENPGRIPLEMIEVQSGSYLGEDDIVRTEDVYGRAPAGDGRSGPA